MSSQCEIIECLLQVHKQKAQYIIEPLLMIAREFICFFVNIIVLFILQCFYILSFLRILTNVLLLIPSSLKRITSDFGDITCNIYFINTWYNMKQQ